MAKPSRVAGPFAGNVLELILVSLPDLRRSDRRVAEHVLADPRAALGASIAETARAAHVSEPTVMRFCAALGFEGYQDFKLRLAQSVALGMPATQSVLERADSPRTLTDKVFDYTMNSLDHARRQIDHAAIGEAIEMLVAARRIEFFGFGASWIVAADAQQKFPLFGVPCVVHLDDHQQFIAASMMRAGDVAVAISNTGQTTGLIEIAHAAREAGAKVIALSGSGTAPLARLCDLVLLVETLENTNVYTPTISRLAALTVIDVLAVGVAMRRGPEHQRRIARMKQRLSTMRSTPLQTPDERA
ncbi:SIS domain-containing protein [Lichenicoccus sp.]|uniref:SIS domain-containing protein n=1 Tax=Lichenicoccus sp. TaxID=2781899 RepID=UPI003D128CA2